MHLVGFTMEMNYANLPSWWWKYASLSQVPHLKWRKKLLHKYHEVTVYNSEITASFKLHSGHSSLPAQDTTPVGHSSLPAQDTTPVLECSHISSSKHLSPTVQKHLIQKCRAFGSRCCVAAGTYILWQLVPTYCGSWYLHTVAAGTYILWQLIPTYCGSWYLQTVTAGTYRLWQLIPTYCDTPDGHP